MKFLFFIMSFFLLYLSCLPCDDSKEYNEKAPVEISGKSHQQENHPESETCTPFCSCSCCPASAFFSPFSKVQGSIIAFSSTKYSLYDITFHSEVSTSIWQPPKLS